MTISELKIALRNKLLNGDRAALAIGQSHVVV